MNRIIINIRLQNFFNFNLYKEKPTVISGGEKIHIKSRLNKNYQLHLKSLRANITGLIVSELAFNNPINPILRSIIRGER